MTQRKWVAKWSMGYIGTDEEEEIDLVDDWGYSEEQVKGMSDEEAYRDIIEYAQERIMEMAETGAEKVE